jgi:hypothetical protein
VKQDPKDYQEQMVQPVRQVQLEAQARLDHKVAKVRQVLMDLLDQPVHRVELGLTVRLDRQDLLGRTEAQVLQAL